MRNKKVTFFVMEIKKNDQQDVGAFLPFQKILKIFCSVHFGIFITTKPIRLYNPERKFRAHLDAVPTENAFVLIDHGMSLLSHIGISLRDIDR